MHSNKIDHDRIRRAMFKKNQKCLRIDTHKATGLKNKSTYEASIRYATSYKNYN